MSLPTEELLWKLTYQISPIILTNGIANLIPGGLLPIVALTQAVDFVDGLLSGGADLKLDDFFAQFRVAAGGKLASNVYGQYPYANQQVAANAVITQPLSVSLIMDTPVREGASYFDKLATMSALKAALDQHRNQGGTFTVATPALLYTNMLLLDLHDVTGNGKQVQGSWQWDFWAPLLTLDQATGAMNNLMSQISSGTALSGMPAWSGIAPTVGQLPSIAGPSVIPSAGNLGGAGVAGSQ
jgi:hypothetical protein